jgi:hypothetical protein
VALAALLVAGGAAWAATLSFAPAKGYPAGDAPNGVAAGDLDGDGDTDLAATNSAIDKVSVLIRRSDGTFIAPRKYAAGDGPGQVVVRNLNGDGDQDLAIANVGDDTVSVLPNRGDGTFGAQRKYAAGPNGPSDIEVGDLDGDGDQNLVSANSGGGFTDGRPDYSILGTVSVFKNRGDGTFAAARNFTAGGAFELSRLDRSDFDGDGDLDLVVSLQFTRAGDGGLAVMFNAGDGSFGLPQRYEIWSPESVIANDLDGDGDQDLATTGTDSYTIEVYKNRGDGTFEYSGSYYLNTEEDGAYGGQYSPGSLTEADFDRDGNVDLDLATSPTLR